MVNLCLVSLKHINKKIKAFYEDFIKKTIFVWIVVLSLINSYILGFISQSNNDFQDLVIDKNPEINLNPENISKNIEEKGSVVASKNGTKYYFVDCSGVNRIKEENKIYFKSVDEAVEDGYEKASSCN